MKLSLVLPVLFGITYGLSPVAQFDVDHDITTREDLFDVYQFDHIYQKRNVNTMLLLLSQLQKSNVIFDMLHSLNNNTQVLAYYQMLSGYLGGASAGNSSTLEKIMPIVEQIWNLTQTSGLLNTTINSLFFNDTNLIGLSMFAGNILASPNNTWISQLLFNLGQGDELSVANINTLINDNHAAVAAAAADAAKEVLFKREEYTDDLFARAANATAGSSSLFLTNILTMFMNSTLLGEFFDALNQTDFITNFVLEFAHDPLAQSGVLNVVKLLNATGVLNNLDLNYYFEAAKEHGMLSGAVQFLLADPVFSPQMAILFNTWEKMGVYSDVWQNMYG